MGVPVVGKNLLSLEYPGPADLVRDPRERRRLQRAFGSPRPHGRDERADLRSGHDRGSRPAAAASMTPPGRASRLLDRHGHHLPGRAPVARMCNETIRASARARVLMKNIAYVGVLAALLELDLKIVDELLSENFRRQAQTHRARTAGDSDSAMTTPMENFDCPLPFQSRPWTGPRGHILIDGNTATALGCLYAGATVGAWYPITPSTSRHGRLHAFCRKYRKIRRPARTTTALSRPKTSSRPSAW